MTLRPDPHIPAQKPHEPLALKSGNFGGPEFFSDALQLMR
jgi:uncharacterized protein YgbK (DUF1537 family)